MFYSKTLCKNRLDTKYYLERYFTLKRNSYTESYVIFGTIVTIFAESITNAIKNAHHEHKFVYVFLNSHSYRRLQLYNIVFEYSMRWGHFDPLVLLSSKRRARIG